MTKFEYWCERGQHWVSEIRCEPMGRETPRCESCCTKEWNGWDDWTPITREVKEPRYVARHSDTGDWYVYDREISLSVAYRMNINQAEEIAALRNKWEEISE